MFSDVEDLVDSRAAVLPRSLEPVTALPLQARHEVGGRLGQERRVGEL